MLWARRNARQPHVAAWLEACSQWDSAIAAGEHRQRNKRRKLCKDHNILCTKAVDNNKDLDATMVYIRQQLINQIQQIHATRKSIQPLLQSKATGPASAHFMQQRSVSSDTTLHPSSKKTEHRRDNKLDNYFKPRVAGGACLEIEELHIPDVATDVSSTYLCLHAKRHIYACLLYTSPSPRDS